MSGYSGTPLARKLGIRSGHVVLALNAPGGFEEQLEGLPDGVDLRREPGSRPTWSSASTPTRRPCLKACVRSRRVDAGLWIAWPKRSSGVPTDITDHVVREVALPLGLVDNKVCAIDETWTGLRLVLRTELRRIGHGSVDFGDQLRGT